MMQGLGSGHGGSNSGMMELAKLLVVAAACSVACWRHQLGWARHGATSVMGNWAKIDEGSVNGREKRRGGGTRLEMQWRRRRVKGGLHTGLGSRTAERENPRRWCGD
ncbi:hypothetical protein M0R45_008975 [Rubus argutus]|uniref:Uncharacterized protein n=1 Tax=Rubus argutus TaxID=59490 RepID=A0AAW1Y5M1_RUBAR